jgi:hypothetical protein
MGSGMLRYWSTSIFIAAALFLLASGAGAHDPSDHYTEWFQNQHNKVGLRCCSGSDAHYLGPEEWTSANGNYRVGLNGRWFDVEDSRMLRPDGGSNPTGKAILWYDINEFGIIIRCFTPEFEF